MRVLNPLNGRNLGVLYSNPNLLDNWYFADPINQRGQTEYTGAVYGIDRWKGLVPANDAEVTDDGIRLKKGGSTWAQYYPFPYKGIAGKTFTFSVLTAGNELLVCTGTAPVAEPNTNIIIANISLENAEFIRFRYDGANKKLSYVAIAPGTYADKTYVAAKLELGTQQTLARKEGDTWALNDPPPNKALELVKCQRYFHIFATQTARPSKAADFCPPMYKEPTLSTLQIGDATYYTASAEL